MINPTYSLQKFSRDMYIRLQKHELHQLKLIHLYSEVFITEFTQPISGSTEWSSFYREVTISMGWDWVLKNDGVPLYLAPKTLLSNIMLVNEKGYDLGHDTTSKICEQVLDCTPWRRIVMAIVHRKTH
jgi:hypothetical protein